MKKKDYITAVKIADTIDWDKVKDNQLLIMVADVYEIAGRYDAARDALLTAYERTGLGRQLAYRLCRLSVKRGDIEEAQEFYEEFTENSPRDAGRYILQYEMAKGSGQPFSKQIEILETYIEADMDDKWAFELAKLYHKAQMSDKCIELCDTIILWFADGKYVEKALELKQLYVPLSEHQRLKYETQKSRKVDVVSGSTTKIIEEAVQKVIEQEAEPPVSEITAGDVSMYVIPPAEEAKKPELELYRDEVSQAQSESTPENNSVNQATSEEIPDGEILDKVHEMDFDVNNVHFKDYSVNNKYDTVNIQKELAQSVSSLFDNTGELFRPIPRQGFEPVEEKVDDQITGQMNLDEVLAMFEAGEFGKKEEATPAENVAEAEAVAETVVEEPIVETIPEETVEEVQVQDVVTEIVEAEEIAADTEIEEISMEIAEDIVPIVDGEPIVEFEAIETEEIESIDENENDIEELEDIEDEMLEDTEDEQVEDEEFLTDETEIDEVENVEADMEETVDEVVQKEATQEFQEFDVDEDGVVYEEEIVADIIANEIIFDVTEEIDEVIEDIVEETIEVASEEPELKETVEEDSEVAESEIQEKEPIMYELKDDFEEETTEYTEDDADIVEEVAEETVEETVVSTEKNIEVKKDSEDDDIKEEPVAEESKPVQTKAKKPVIQSDTAKEELKKFIARFSGVQGLDKQILKVMQNTLKGDDSPVKFIFVKGEVKSGKTTLAIDVLKLANKMMQRRDQRIAKIKAESINGKSIDALLVKLGGSDVLIEKVSDMQPDIFAEFIDKLKAEGADRFVIFEDEKSLAENFLAKVPEAYRDFANILDIKQNKIKDWTKMASNYAESKGYAFDEMGILALSAKIDQLRAITLVVHKNHIEQLVDGAIKRANKFSFAKLFGKPKNEEGLILLTEKDFID